MDQQSVNDPGQQAQPQHVTVANRPVGKVRNPVTVIILMIVTFGIYTLIFYYQTFDEIRNWRNQGWSGVTYILLAILFAPATIAVPWLLPSYVGNMYQEDGKEKPITGMTGFWIFLPIIGPFVWLFKVIGRLNEFWISKGATA